MERGADSVAAAASSDPVDPYGQEVRVAIALNGGVSLAVWMGGCVVEIDCARRAHLGAEPISPMSPDDLIDPLPGGPPDRAVYAALCQAFRRELVVDIMTGASAGGINGALLATAIRFRRRLHPDYLRTRWLSLGSFADLLQPARKADPVSLMDGDLFHADLLEVFSTLRKARPAADGQRSPVALPTEHEALKALDARLEVTATNVAGEERTFTDYWGETLYAREYRARFSFRRDADYTASNLASAARASASFPVAFEPLLVADDDQRRLGELSQPRWVIDGGLLDNAPIAPALRLIPRRPAVREVQRFLCYVNADPPQRPPPAAAGTESPRIREMVGYLVGLPRKAPFVDQMAAIEDEVARGDASASITPKLLTLDLDVLRSVARTLLPAYVAAEAQAVPPAPKPAALPSLDPDFGASTWGWTIRATEGVLNLLVDVLRWSIAVAEDTPHRQQLLETRQRVFHEIVALTDPDAPAVTGEQVTHAVRTAAGAVFEVRDDLYTEDGQPLGRALFGRFPGVGDRALEHFLRRALSIEVVRSAATPGTAATTAQKLRFAQLTPFAPTPILSAAPFSRPDEPSPDAKLTGTGLGHFSGFYRRTWRANDFMWGRLDAAARMVQLLVDPCRLKSQHCPEDAQSAARTLASSLLSPCQLRDEHASLAREALVDAVSPDSGLPPLVRAAVACLPTGDSPALLRPVLEKALAADLGAPDGGTLTRVVCTRAAQLEILAHELWYLVGESERDEKLGPGTPSLPYSKQDTWAAIEGLRKNEPLPKLLGRDDPEELVSNLALRTITHGVFVALSVLRTNKVPGVVPLSVVRVPLFGVAGMVSRSFLTRAVTVAGFVGAALFATARALQAPSHSVAVSTIDWKAAALTVIAVLVTSGIAVVAVGRAWHGRRWRWALDSASGALLAATGGLVAVALAMTAGKNDLADVVLASDPEGHKFQGVFWLAAATVLGLPVAAKAIPQLGSRAFRFVQTRYASVVALVLVVVTIGFSLGWSGPVVYGAFDNGWRMWEFWAAGLGTASLPVAGAYILLRRVAHSD